ncbi:MAG TPA: hypothetical protein VFX12_12785 [Vicinamibacterales bacterium]|nr:hypothetical protein [Vicinamibacterales bacterium]
MASGGPLCAAAAILAFVGLAQPAFAAVIRVPDQAPTIQAAVDAASPGDQIRVASGQWCGATLTRPVALVGEGQATIVGCDASPTIAGVLRVGFFLPDASSSGTTIRNFTFDGRGSSNANLAPLAFAVFGRNADNVLVEGSTVLGTIQAITDAGGDGWTVTHNTIADFSALTCDGFCGGGDAIVFEERTGTSLGRNNAATFNVITGRIPDGLTEFDLTGIFAMDQDGTTVTGNRISIPTNPAATAAGEAIVLTDHCCGESSGYGATVNSYVVNNDGRGSTFSVVIEPDAGGGSGNAEGTTLRGNFGEMDIDGSASTVTNRSIRTLIVFP